jgi:hypothetical protein
MQTCIGLYLYLHVTLLSMQAGQGICHFRPTIYLTLHLRPSPPLKNKISHFANGPLGAGPFRGSGRLLAGRLLDSPKKSSARRCRCEVSRWISTKTSPTLNCTVQFNFGSLWAGMQIDSLVRRHPPLPYCPCTPQGGDCHPDVSPP